jgi:hypothetical protein
LRPVSFQSPIVREENHKRNASSTLSIANRNTRFYKIKGSGSRNFAAAFRRSAMFKRVGLFLALVVVFVLLAAPMGAQARDRAWYEGVYFREYNRWTAFAVEMTATKLVDGAYRQSLVNINYPHPITCYYPRIVETVVLHEDPDELSVSRDLGWGGLHGWAIVHNQCDNNREMLMEFDVDLYGNVPYTYDDASGYFTRNARLTGTIKIDGAVYWDFSREPAGDYHEFAHTFSTRYPG